MTRAGMLGFACVALAVGCRSEHVVRVFDGREVPGRWVSPDAYAAFAIAAIEESKGDRRAAAAAYERAIAEDPANAAAWGRLGAMLCTSTRRAADAAFARAEALEPDLESPWVARAACALERNDAPRAVKYAERAAALAPDDDEASRLVAVALERTGARDAAASWLRALALRLPEAHRAPADPAGPAALLEGALRDGDIDEIERAAIGARVGSDELSLRAVASGRYDSAKRVALRVLAADPSSSNARIAALVTADIEGDEPSFDRTLRDAPKNPTGPSELGAHVMESILARRVGPDAARAWRDAYGSVHQR